MRTLLKYFQIFSLLVLFLDSGNCQSLPDTIDTHITHIPNTLATHPLGLFISRIHYNFRTQAIKKPALNLSVSNGNVWLPQVKAYIPTYQADKTAMSNMLWHHREGAFDAENTSSENYALHADGVFRVLRLKFEAPLTVNQDISLELRAFTIDGGFSPYASITNDDFIEWVHTNVHGGEDPFARKVYGLHQAQVLYTNEKGETMYYDADDFIVPGIELAYNLYPKLAYLNDRRFYLNASVNMGVNTTKYNPCIDLGISSTLMKEFTITRNVFTLATGLGVLRQQLIKFNEGYLLNFNKYLYNCELLASYKCNLKSGDVLLLATNLHIQMPYRNPKETDYLVMTGERYTSHWNHAASHLYRPLLAHSFIFTYSWLRVSISAYAREDFLVDNAPDAQTGVELQYTF